VASDDGPSGSKILKQPCSLKVPLDSARCQSESCVICLAEFKDDASQEEDEETGGGNNSMLILSTSSSVVRPENCAHLFHRECLLEWLQTTKLGGVNYQRSLTCPVCATPLVNEAAAAAAPAATGRPPRPPLPPTEEEKESEPSPPAPPPRSAVLPLDVDG
jgi:hypothetical protein